MADVRTEAVSYGPSTLGGFLALPAGKGPFPGLVVIHEWWGLNDQIRAVTGDLARAGYAALAVDLYRGTVTKNPDEARQLAMGLDRPRALSDLAEAYGWLSARSDVRRGKVGSVGWCMGGGYSLGLAMAEPKLAACVVYYGRLETDTKVLAKIGAPVMGFFGRDDQSIPPDAVHAFEKAMQSAGRKVTVRIYDGAGHAFANPTRTDAYRPEATKDSWDRMMRFLGEALR